MNKFGLAIDLLFRSSKCIDICLQLAGLVDLWLAAARPYETLLEYSVLLAELVTGVMWVASLQKHFCLIWIRFAQVYSARPAVWRWTFDT